MGHARADGTASTNDEGDRTKVYHRSSEHARTKGLCATEIFRHESWQTFI